MLNRCDCCGRFRSWKAMVRVMGEYDEEWNECYTCFPPKKEE